MKLEFSWHIAKKYSDVNSHERCPMGAMLLRVDRHTDGQNNRQTHMMKLTVAFRKYTKNAPKNDLPNTWKMPLVMPISFFAMQWYDPKSEGPTFVMFNCIWVWNYKHILHIKSVTLLEICRFFDCVCITVKLSQSSKLSSDIWLTS